MKKIIIIMLTGLSLLFMLNCDESSDSDSGTSTDTTDVRLAYLPDVDVSKKDLSVQDGRTIACTRSVGDKSIAACSAKTLRNRAIFLSKKAQSVLDLLKSLDEKISAFEVKAGMNYYKFEKITIPGYLITDDTSGIVMRVNKTEDIIIVDFVTGMDQNRELRDLQVIFNDNSDDDDDTYKIEVVSYEKSATDTLAFEKTKIVVDTTQTDTFIAEFYVNGIMSNTGGHVGYKFKGIFTSDETDPDNIFNTSEGFFGEDFTIDGDATKAKPKVIQYTKFNKETGTTKYEHGDRKDTTAPATEISSWDVVQNLVMNNSESGFYTDVNNYVLQTFDYDSFDFSFSSEEGSIPWTGSLESGYEWITIGDPELPDNWKSPEQPFEYPVEPAWNKKDDNTNCFGGDTELTEQLEGID